MTCHPAKPADALLASGQELSGHITQGGGLQHIRSTPDLGHPFDGLSDAARQGILDG